jgi:hypothetical protein
MYALRSFGESDLIIPEWSCRKFEKHGAGNDGTIPDGGGHVSEAAQYLAKNIFRQVFLLSFAVHMVKLSIYLADGDMWANQIKYFLEKNSLVFDFHAAYGHPGTSLVTLGCILHTVFGLSFRTAVTVSASLLLSTVTASCASLCYLLKPASLWWFTTAFILTLSRFYVAATPPTAIVMPLVVLLVLSSCWLWDRTRTGTRWLHFLWGVIVGISASTRLDVTLLVGMPLFLLLSFRSGAGVIAPIAAGVCLSFFLTDPFLWFMPVRHVSDLMSKFTLHYSNYTTSRTIPWPEWAHGIPLATIAIVLFLFLLARRKTPGAIPTQPLLVFLGITLTAGLLLTSSKFQAIRYLYPLIIVWEILLPLFLLEQCHVRGSQVPLAAGNLDTYVARVLLFFVIPTQVLGYFFMFIT